MAPASTPSTRRLVLLAATVRATSAALALPSVLTTRGHNATAYVVAAAPGGCGPAPVVVGADVVVVVVALVVVVGADVVVVEAVVVVGTGGGVGGGSTGPTDVACSTPRTVAAGSCRVRSARLSALAPRKAKSTRGPVACAAEPDRSWPAPCTPISSISAGPGRPRA